MPDLKNELFQGAAGYYLGHEWSVMPVEPGGKKPLVDWKSYQGERCAESDLSAWWDKWPKANVGVITGKISGVTVVDIDTAKGQETIAPYVKDLKTPTAKTQKGGTHLYFQYVPGLTNSVRRLDGVDLRNDGGFVVAPPSRGMWGNYEWVPGLELGIVSLAPMPPALVEAFKNPAKQGEAAQPARVVDASAFDQGKRNDTLFHYALALSRGGHATEAELASMLEPLNKLCRPPLPASDLLTIVRSALRHDAKDDRNWSTEVRDWVEYTGGQDFGLTAIYGDLGAKDTIDKTAVRVAIRRMVESKNIEPCGRRHGWYRKIVNTRSPIDIMAASAQALDIKLPLGLDQMVNLYPGNIIVVAGEQDVGKTAFMIEVARLNQERYEIDYFSSEMGASEFSIRLSLYDNIALSDWKFHPYEQEANFQDVVEPNRISIIDYFEISDEFWRIAGSLAKIHEKLNGTGLAIVALQKGKGKEFGRGADFGMEKPRLYVTMSRAADYRGGVAKIIKAKNWKTDQNPNGMMRPFKILRGHEFLTDYPWMSISDYDAEFGTENGQAKGEGRLYPRRST